LRQIHSMIESPDRMLSHPDLSSELTKYSSTAPALTPT
jgi:hypothetical protein